MYVKMMILCLIGSTATTTATTAKKECENFKDYGKAKKDVCPGLVAASYANGIYNLYALAQYMSGGANGKTGSSTAVPIDFISGITKYVPGTKINADPVEKLPADKFMERLTDLKLHNSLELDSDEPDGKRNAWAFTARASKTTIVICFKGTEPTKVMDWKANVKATEQEAEFGVGGTKTQKIKVHKGFWGYYHSNRKTILAAVKKMMDGDTNRIIVTGHSLGGAQANLCAVDFALLYPEKEIALWTFGSPRAFKAETVQEANKIQTQGKNSAHRIFAKGDMVTSLPLSKMGFSHSSKGFYLRRDATKEKDQLRNCGMNDNARGVYVSEHSMTDSYIPRLKAVCHKKVTFAQDVTFAQRFRQKQKLGRSKQQLRGGVLASE